MNIAEKAVKIVYGDREITHGDPSVNIGLISELWTAYTGSRISSEDVCNMMVLLKIARLKTNPNHEDSSVDVIGYTLLRERIRENDE